VGIFADATAQKLSHRLVEACRAQFVSFLRLLEWRDVHRQPSRHWRKPAGTATALPKTFDALRYAALHKAVLVGLLGNIGIATADTHYAGRGTAVPLASGSA
jgi:ATP-dependent helicase HrpA